MNMLVDTLAFQQGLAGYAFGVNRETAPSKLTVYFDGSCPICSREIGAYRRQAGAENCSWVDASTSAESDLGSGLSRSEAIARFHVRRVDGTLETGMQAFALLWLELPRTAWAGRIAQFGPIPTILEACYRLFLRARPLWRAPVPNASKVRPGTPNDSDETVLRRSADRTNS